MFHHLQKLCPGGHDQLHLRGGGLAASAALYPDPECELILLDAQLPSDARKGVRILVSDDTSVDTVSMMPFQKQLVTLHSIAKIRGLTKVWDDVVHPWLQADGA